MVTEGKGVQKFTPIQSVHGSQTFQLYCIIFAFDKIAARLPLAPYVSVVKETNHSLW